MFTSEQDLHNAIWPAASGSDHVRASEDQIAFDKEAGTDYATVHIADGDDAGAKRRLCKHWTSSIYNSGLLIGYFL